MRISATLLLAAAALLPQAGRAQTNPAPAATDSAVALAAFDSAWARVRNFHYDSTFGGQDWGAVRAALRPRVEREPTLERAREAIRDMIGRLGVSHYALIPRELSDALSAGERERTSEQTESARADAGVELRAVAGDVVVWRLDPEGPAARAGLAPGAVVLAIDDYRPPPALRELAALPDSRQRQLALTRFLYAVNRLLEGAPGDTVRLAVRAPGRDSASFTLALRPTPGTLVRFGNVPALIARVEQRRLTEGDVCVGVIRWTAFLAPLAREIDRAVDAVRDCRGIVLDLRGNPGGVAGMVMGIGGHFVDSTRALGTMKLRNDELRFVVNPRRVDSRGQAVPVYSGRLAILLDPMSASTSEIFAAGLQAIGRARIFGELSAGQALPALAFQLPGGDVLMHAIADYLVTDGTRVEGRGVIPDEHVPLTGDDLLAGRDAVLEAARRWILAPAT